VTVSWPFSASLHVVATLLSSHWPSAVVQYSPTPNVLPSSQG
jgi:hypothetical protein